jgi:hypothetical protein
LLHLVGYLYYWQMGFNSVFKRLNKGFLYLIHPSTPAKTQALGRWLFIKKARIKTEGSTRG